MNKRSSALARAIAAIALIGGFVLVIAVAAISLGGSDGGDGRKGGAKAAKTRDAGRDAGPAPKSYVVQNGDTLTSIAHRAGVSVARIQELNPGVDPQILVSGEKLKLRR